MPAYSGGVIDDRSMVLGATPQADTATLIANSCTASGWTVTDLGFWNFLEFGLAPSPANNDTVTIDGQVYTFKTTLTPAANEVLIGASPLTAAQNLKAAINGEAGAGTLYGAGTAVNAGVTAIAVGEVTTTTINVRVQLWVITKTGAAIVVSEVGSTTFWANSTLGGKLYKLESQTTPGYQKATAYLGGFPLTSTNTLCLMLQNRDATVWGGVIGQRTNVLGDNVRVISHRYGFHSFPVGLFGTSARSRGVYLQVPHLYENTRPNKIIGATNATPIEITTEIAHGYVTGDVITQRYVAGNLAANGTFTITVTSPTKYTLNGSVGSGAFTGTLGLAQNTTSPRKEISDAVFASLDNGGSSNSWLISLVSYGDVAERTFQIVDGVYHRSDASKAWGLFIDSYMGRAGTRQATSWGNGTAPAVEAGFVFDSLFGTPAAAMGQIYNVFTARAASIPGGAAVTYDGHTWYGAYNNDANGQLFIASS